MLIAAVQESLVGTFETCRLHQQLEQFVSCWIEITGSGWEPRRAPWLRGRGCHDDIHVETQVEIRRMRCRAGLRDGPVGRGICQRRWWAWWRWGAWGGRGGLRGGGRSSWGGSRGAGGLPGAG